MKLLVVISLCAFTSSLNAIVTQQDINSINALIGSLEGKIKSLENVLKLAEDTKNLFRGTLVSTEKIIGKSITNREKQIKKHQVAWKKNLLDNVTNSFKAAKSNVKWKSEKDLAAAVTTKNQIFNEVKVAEGKFRNDEQKALYGILKPLGVTSTSLTKEFEALKKSLKKAVEKRNAETSEAIEGDLHLLSQQVQLQQFNEYEKARSDGHSGIKDIRSLLDGGLKNYYSSDHNGRSFAGIYNKETTRRQVGVGEFVAVLNGIEFRAGKKSYDLKKPASEKTFHKTENVDFPTVPSSVSQLTDPKKQIDEMREWFKAFQKQDATRDYKKHFKPVLSYLEGAWTTDSEDERMREMIHYSSFTGLSGHNNFIEYLPRTIMGFSSKRAQYSQWKYRILAHPVTQDIPTSYLRLVADPITQKRFGISSTEYKHSPSARFNIEGVKVDGHRTDNQPLFYTKLDEIMEDVPGKDNYGGKNFADGFNSKIYPAHPGKEQEELNAAYYHRAYKLGGKYGKGTDTAQHGFSDRMYVALTTQEKISGPEHRSKNGKKIKIKASYAIPFELIYLNPLHQWNPYNIKYEENCNSVTGSGTEQNPYSAACPERHFLTPNSFYTGINTCSTPENGDELFYFKSPNNSKPVCLRASGVRIVLPKIHSIENHIRQRYPVAPVNGEGSSVWKKLNAIEDSITLPDEENQKPTYMTGESTNPKISPHRHAVVLTEKERNDLVDGTKTFIQKVTEPDDKHRHIMNIKMIMINGEKKIGISACDSGPPGSVNGTVCFDGHEQVLEKLE